jgi:anti-sigma factor RsiW
MECVSVRERLRDLARGRVTPADEAELRRHVGSCAACRHEEAAERLVDEALARQVERIVAPARLRAVAREVVARVRAEDARAARRGRVPSTWAIAAAAAAIFLAVVGYAAGRSGAEQAAAAGRLGDELVSDHLRLLAMAHPHDVESTSSHEVKPWFEGRLDFAPVVPGDRGELRLLGGGIGYVLDRKAAVVSYALRRHRVTLLVFPRAGLPGIDRVAPGAAPLALARRGFTAAVWAAGELGYALVSDVAADELLRLAEELAPETRRAPRAG